MVSSVGSLGDTLSPSSISHQLHSIQEEKSLQNKLRYLPASHNLLLAPWVHPLLSHITIFLSTHPISSPHSSPLYLQLYLYILLTPYILSLPISVCLCFLLCVFASVFIFPIFFLLLSLAPLPLSGSLCLFLYFCLPHCLPLFHYTLFLHLPLFLPPLPSSSSCFHLSSSPFLSLTSIPLFSFISIFSFKPQLANWLVPLLCSHSVMSSTSLKM